MGPQHQSVEANVEVRLVFECDLHMGEYGKLRTLWANTVSDRMLRSKNNSLTVNAFSVKTIQQMRPR